MHILTENLIICGCIAFCKKKKSNALITFGSNLASNLGNIRFYEQQNNIYIGLGIQ